MKTGSFAVPHHLRHRKPSSVGIERHMMIRLHENANFPAVLGHPLVDRSVDLKAAAVGNHRDFQMTHDGVENHNWQCFNVARISSSKELSNVYPKERSLLTENSKAGASAPTGP